MHCRFAYLPTSPLLAARAFTLTTLPDRAHELFPKTVKVGFGVDWVFRGRHYEVWLYAEEDDGGVVYFDLTDQEKRPQTVTEALEDVLGRIRRLDARQGVARGFLT